MINVIIVIVVIVCCIVLINRKKKQQRFEMFNELYSEIKNKGLYIVNSYPYVDSYGKTFFLYLDDKNKQMLMHHFENNDTVTDFVSGFKLEISDGSIYLSCHETKTYIYIRDDIRKDANNKNLCRHIFIITPSCQDSYYHLASIKDEDSNFINELFEHAK